MKPDIRYSKLLEAAIRKVDGQEVARESDSRMSFDVEPDEVQAVFNSGWGLALLLADARAGGADARVYSGDDEDSNHRFFFIATSEDEAVARVAALKPRLERGRR
jgi:hypothetical protein